MRFTFAWSPLTTYEYAKSLHLREIISGYGEVNRALILANGLSQLPVFMVERGLAKSVLCSDIACLAGKYAEYLGKQSSGISYQNGDLFDLQPIKGPFDLVILTDFLSRLQQEDKVMVLRGIAESVELQPSACLIVNGMEASDLPLLAEEFIVTKVVPWTYYGTGFLDALKSMVRGFVRKDLIRNNELYKLSRESTSSINLDHTAATAPSNFRMAMIAVWNEWR